MTDSFGGRQIPFRAAMVTMLIAFAGAGTAFAQAEDIEPRTVGSRGATFVGLSGFVDRFSSSDEALPSTTSRLMSVVHHERKFAIRIGAIGSGSLGGEHEDDLLTGSSTVAARGRRSSHYFTPRSMISMYVGAEYGRSSQRGGGYRVRPGHDGAAGRPILARQLLHPGGVGAGWPEARRRVGVADRGAGRAAHQIRPMPRPPSLSVFSSRPPHASFLVSAARRRS
jgi:hypothetical protein